MSDTPSVPEPVEYVSAEVLRTLFNEVDYTQLVDSGQISIIIRKDKHLIFPEARQGPHCTMGQFLEYIDKKGQWHAQAYQYLRPDGTLGASGKPDPKRIRKDGKIWALDTKKAAE